MATMSQCLCGRATPLAAYNHHNRLPIIRITRTRINSKAGACLTLSPFAKKQTRQRQRLGRATAFLPLRWWWNKDALPHSSKPKQKRQFLWQSVHDPVASSDDSDSLPENSHKCDEWTQNLPKVDWLDSILGFPKRAELWTVPWTAETIIQVMMLWFLAFWFVGSWIIPFLAHTAGFRKDCMTYRAQALYSLVTDVAEGTVGLAILYNCLARFQPLPNDWFRISWRGNWLIDACLGCLMFPIVNRLSQINIDLLPFPSHFTASHVEQSFVARDPVAMLLYAIVVSICAPIWEEIIFRGFLLPSLTRYMSLRCSICVSAIAFALAHFSMQRLLPLTFLGLVMGIVFVRSRNLLASMLLHSLWNGFVFLDLLR